MKIFLALILALFSFNSLAQVAWDTAAASVVRAKLIAGGQDSSDLVVNRTVMAIKRKLIDAGSSVYPYYSLAGSSFLRGFFAMIPVASPYIILTNESYFSITPNLALATIQGVPDSQPMVPFSSWTFTFNYTVESDGYWTPAPPSNTYSSKIGQACISGCSQFPVAPASARFTRSFTGKDFTQASKPDVQITIACNDVRLCADAQLQYLMWNAAKQAKINDVKFPTRELVVSGNNYYFHYVFSVDMNYYGSILNDYATDSSVTFIGGAGAVVNGTMAEILADHRFDGEYISIQTFASWISQLWNVTRIQPNYDGAPYLSAITNSDISSVTTPVLFRSLVEPVSLFVNCTPPTVLQNNACFCVLPNTEVNGVCTVPSQTPPPPFGGSVATDFTGTPNYYSPPSSGGSSGGSVGGSGSTAWLGGNPNISAPTLEDTPTANSVITKVFGLLPTFKNLSLSHGSVQCPRFETLEFWGHTFVFDQHCQLAENVRQLVGSLSVVCFSLISLFVVLKA
ncbi:hypothetical protein [Undibacterium sp. Ji22W]|uniref:hypothetical protein n=1 Tax=Undibacterium sp. Ji22W TaxID=3413038 RepID=UPI003BF0899F